MKLALLWPSFGAALLFSFAACSGSSSVNGVPGGPGANGGGDGGPGGNGPGGGDGGACVPQCTGKTCGDDGCGGSCGSCGVYQRCDVATSACVAACDLTPLEASKTIDLNLRVAAVHGSVTWNGSTPPSLSNSEVVFVDKKTSESLRAPLSASYSAVIYAGTYMVAVDTTRESASGMPHQYAIVKDDLVVTGDAAVDLAVSTATLSGTVAVDGAKPSAGSVTARSAQNGSASVDVSSGTFSLPVFAGTYDVGFDSVSAGTTLPRQALVVKKAMNVTGAASVDLALTTSVLTGSVTANGAALPAETSHGDVLLTSSDVSTTSASLGTDGTFSVKVYAGTYDVVFDSTASTKLPRLRVVLDAKRALSGAQSGAYDVKPVTLTGNVTLNGAVLPDDTAERGSLQLVGTGGISGSVPASLGTSGASSYSAQVYAGTYDVHVESNGSQKVLPNQSAVVKRGTVVSAGAKLDVDLATSRVQGTVTADGAALGDQEKDRGYVVLRERSTGSTLDVSVGTKGPAAYSAVVYQGSYGIDFRTSSDNKSLPQQSTHVADKKITQDTALDLPLKTLTVMGAVKVNGADMSDASDTSQSRGDVVFVDKLTASRITYDVKATGPANYTLSLFDGGYDVHFEAGSSQKVVPAVDERVLSGCVPVNTACARSDKDLSGSWILDFAGWGQMDLTLAQANGSFSGNANSSWGAGPVTGGSRSASSVKLLVDTSGVELDLTGDVANGCFMSGRAVASTGYATDWLGQRLDD